MREIRIFIIDDDDHILDDFNIEFGNYIKKSYNNADAFFEDKDKTCLSNIDIFFLDFDLGDGVNIVNSGIYSEIIKVKKEEAKIVSISFLEENYIISKIDALLKSSDKKTYPDAFLGKDITKIKNYIENSDAINELDQKQNCNMDNKFNYDLEKDELHIKDLLRKIIHDIRSFELKTKSSLEKEGLNSDLYTIASKLGFNEKYYNNLKEFNKNNPMVELLVASIKLSKIKNNKTFTSFAMEIECLSPEKLMNNLVEKFELNNPNSFPNMLVNAFEKTGISVRRFFKDYVLRDILLDETGIITGRFSILILYIIKIMKLDSDDFKKITFMLDSFLDKIKYNNNTEFNDKLEDLEKLQIQLCRDIIKNLPKNNNAEQKIPRKKQNFLKKIYRKYMTDIPDWI